MHAARAVERLGRTRAKYTESDPVSQPPNDPKDPKKGRPGPSHLVPIEGGGAAPKRTDERTPPASERAPCGRLPIVLSADFAATVDASEEALARDETVFAQWGKLVRVAVEKPKLRAGVEIPATPIVVPLTTPALRDRLSRVAIFEKDAGERGTIEVKPPKDEASALLDRGAWTHIRRLESIAAAPFLRPNGTICDRPGYDEATGILALWEGEWRRVAETPTAAELAEAVATLREPFTDFPWLNGEHESAFLALILTLVGRPAIPGCCPFFLIEANIRGAGKSKLAFCASLIAYGDMPATCNEPSSDEELRKRITAVLAASYPFVLIDNIATRIAFPSLDAVLSSEKWGDRILGHSAVTDVPARTVWAGTGNNAALGGDVSRRTILIRLHSRRENPEDREGLKHPDLFGYVRSRRKDLVWAALTIWRAWWAAGRPDGGLKTMSSFEGWSFSVPRALVFAGRPNPMLTRLEVEAEDVEKAILESMMRVWEQLYPDNEPTTVGEFMALVSPEGAPRERTGALAAAAAVVDEFAPHKGGRATTRSLGFKLRAVKDRVIGDRCFVSPDKDRTGTLRWKLERF